MKLLNGRAVDIIKEFHKGTGVVVGFIGTHLNYKGEEESIYIVELDLPGQFDSEYRCIAVFSQNLIPK